MPLLQQNKYFDVKKANYFNNEATENFYMVVDIEH